MGAVAVELLTERERVITVVGSVFDDFRLFVFDLDFSGAERSMNERGEGVKLEPIPRYRC